MRFRRHHKKIFATCMAIFMFVGEVGNLPPSSALAKQTDVVNAANSNIPAPKTEESVVAPAVEEGNLPIGGVLANQTDGEQIVETTADSNIPAPKTQESVVVPTGEEGSLPIGGVLANQTDGEQIVENVANSNIPVPETEESIVVPTGEDESEGEDQGEEAPNKDAKISVKVLSGDENEKTIDNIELQELSDSDIPFVEGPNDAGAEFVIESGTEKHLSFTIPEEGFSPGSYVIVVDTVAGSDFNFSCTVTDSESQTLAQSYYYYSEYDSSRNVYFNLENPGTYQFNVFDYYCYNEDNKNATLSAKVHKTIDPPAFGVTEEKFTEPFDLTFTNIPEGCNVYYYINDYSHNRWEEQEDTLYDPQNPAKINTACYV